MSNLEHDWECNDSIQFYWDWGEATGLFDFHYSLIYDICIENLSFVIMA